MADKLTEIVVADLIAPDQDKYKEVFYEQHLAARKYATKSAAE